MRIYNIIKQKLERAFAPQLLEIIDESEKHRGHSGFIEGGETHFRIKIVSQQFINKNRITRQRMIYKTLVMELSGRVHALALICLTEDENKSIC